MMIWLRKMVCDSDPVSKLYNLGEKCEHLLKDVGINNVGELKKAGYLNAYLSLKTRYPRHINRMFLYALYGAFNDINCMKLTRETKDKLETEMQERIRQARHYS